MREADRHEGSLQADDERRAVLAYVLGACKTLPTPITISLHHHTSGTLSVVMRIADEAGTAGVDAWHAAMNPTGPAPRTGGLIKSDHRVNPWRDYRCLFTIDLGEHGQWRAELWCSVEEPAAPESTGTDGCAVNDAAEPSTAADGCAVKDGE